MTTRDTFCISQLDILAIAELKLLLTSQEIRQGTPRTTAFNTAHIQSLLQRELGCYFYKLPLSVYVSWIYVHVKILRKIICE